MGGLVGQAAVARRDTPLPAADVKQLITLGTPFGGSIKAVLAMDSGDVIPFGWAIRPKTKRRIRALARQMPSVHDLLPRFPCAYEPGSTKAPARPTEQQFVAAGANPGLTRRSMAAHTQLEDALTDPGRRIEKLVSLAGINQPTLQSFWSVEGRSIFDDDGIYDAANDQLVNWGGDGTVYYHAAYPKGGPKPMTSLPQPHGALASSEEALAFVRTNLLDGDYTDLQGPGVGLRVADSVIIGEPATVRVVVPRDTNVQCAWTERATGRGGIVSLGPPSNYDFDQADGPSGHDTRDGAQVWTQPGLYTITVNGGGSSPIRADVLVEQDDE
jgi:hypothetical protein